MEFRSDVVAVARNGEATIAEIAKDFGISESSSTAVGPACRE
jgi:transposase-like protein